MIRVLIVASSSISQSGLETLLRASSSLQVVGVLSDFGQLSEKVEELQPDVVIAEITGQDTTLPEEIPKLVRRSSGGDRALGGRRKFGKRSGRFP